MIECGFASDIEVKPYGRTTRARPRNQALNVESLALDCGPDRGTHLSTVSCSGLVAKFTLQASAPKAPTDQRRAGQQMRILLLSDLHLEFGCAPPQLAASLDFDVVVAAGDIGEVNQAIAFLANLGRPVVYVLGNHERWRMDLDGAVDQAKRLAQGSNVHVLERDSAVVEGVRFLGTTLWTDVAGGHTGVFNAVDRFQRDFNGQITAARYRSGPHALAHQALTAGQTPTAQPGNFDARVAAIEHAISRKWLSDCLSQESELPTVIVTHHAPTLESVWRTSPGLRDWTQSDEHWCRLGAQEDLNAIYSYASNMDGFIRRHRKSIDVWCHGHLHARLAFRAGVKVRCAPGGPRTLTARDIVIV